MKIHVGDVIGLCGEISGHKVEKVLGRGMGLEISDGRWIRLSDVYVVRTDNEDGTATETFSDGRIRTVELE